MVLELEAVHSQADRTAEEEALQDKLAAGGLLQVQRKVPWRLVRQEHHHRQVGPRMAKIFDIEDLKLEGKKKKIF